jgi:peptide deformylase
MCMSKYDPSSRYTSSSNATTSLFDDEWRAELVEPSHPALKRPATLDPVSAFGVDWDSREQELIDLMHSNLGMGLSAPQIGSAYRMFVMSHSMLGDIGVYNPIIVKASEVQVKSLEGCLTWPLLYLPVTRHEEILLRFYRRKDGGFVQVEMGMDGMDSICAQHEIDHLNGITFLHHVSDFQLRRAKAAQSKRFKKLARRMR